MTGKERVLRELLRRPNFGVDVSDFPNGFRLAARIHDLIKAGYEIKASHIPGGVATYKLVQPCE